MVEESLLSVEFIYCACKCGFTTWKYDSRGRERNYIRGHQFRVLVRTEQHCKRISQAKLGHEVSKDTREKLRKHFKGKPISEETKKKIGLANIGQKNSNWKGGKNIDPYGYYRVWVPEHPFHDSRGYVFEHRLVYEKHYNCCLLPWILIHHKNEIKTDNRIENLEPMTRAQHSKYHFKNKKVDLFLKIFEVMGFED